MPTAAPKPCIQCGALVRDGTSRCDAHKVKAWAKREGEQQGRGGRPWRRMRDRVMQRDGGLCQPCQRNRLVTLASEVDHIVSLADGGDDAIGNLEAICKPCHRLKTAGESVAGRGVQMSTAPASDTDPPVNFLCAQVLGGGVSPDSGSSPPRPAASFPKK